MVEPALVWFRHDLRLADNPALLAAVERGGPVIPVYVWSPEEEGRWPPGAASRWWLRRSLIQLDESLRRRGSRLIVRRGPALESLNRLLAESGATAVHWNRRYEPAVVARDREVKASLKRDGFRAESHNGSLLFEPWEVRARDGGSYQMFTPFWKACLALPRPGPPAPAPDRVPSPERWPDSLAPDDLELEPPDDGTRSLGSGFRPGEAGAAARLSEFLDGLEAYPEARDRPGVDGSSRLSPHLHFGEIGPRQVWRAVSEAAAAAEAADAFLRELGWREFAHHVLWNFPETTERPLRENFAAFPWERDARNLDLWTRGQTGYPIVDAGMRQLRLTGWMPNRVRMIAASFLVKHLLISWNEGAAWFWDSLVDADLANNTLNWQWVAGCGADAAPYFRVFNPIVQGERFDPDGQYVRRWAAALERMPSRWIHKPWEAPPDAPRAAGVTLGRDYPGPLVDHREARERALAAYEVVRRGGG